MIKDKCAEECDARNDKLQNLSWLPKSLIIIYNLITGNKMETLAALTKDDPTTIIKNTDDGHLKALQYVLSLYRFWSYYACM